MAKRYWRTPLAKDASPPVPGEVHVIAERCKGCGFCIEFCPRDVLKEASGWNRRGYRFPEAVKQADCAECHLCELLCPEFAIFITRGAPAPAPAAAPAAAIAVTASRGVEGSFDV